MATTLGLRPGKEGGRGLASKLFNKFDSDRKYDPFQDTDPVIQDCREGMEALLSMCNAVEISSLFGALGFVVPCPRSAKEKQIMEYIREGGRRVEKKFAEVLKFCWEGLLFEYLRTVGCPLRDREHDPRHFVMRYWRRSILDPSIKPGFVPYYAKREIKKRSNMMQEDRDIRDIRAELAVREDRVKDAEARTRGQHDYRFVLQYFSASRDLHRTLVDNVNYLTNEVEQLRANMDHTTESISIMEQQFVEIETMYDRVVGGLVHRGAFQLTLEGALYGMITEGNVAIKNAEQVANELLRGMNTGPEEYDPVEDDAVDDATAEPDNTSHRADDKEVPPTECAATDGPAAAGLAALGQTEQKGEKEGVKKGEPRRSCGVLLSEGGGAAEWAAPRLRAGLTRPDHSSNQEVPAREYEVLTEEGGVALSARKGTLGDNQRNDHSSGDGGGTMLERCLDRVLETHQRACARYANQIEELQGQNAGLAARAADAVRLEEEATAQARSWEARHSALEERLADVERRSKEELKSAEKRADEARSRSLEVSNLLKDALKKATPTLLELVSGIAPRDTEGPGVDLFRSLGINPDLYSHVLASKRMFEADLESRAFEIVEAERKIGLTRAEAEQVEAAATAAAGGKKKGERGRPKSRGKEGSGAGKGKSGASKSKSRSKSASGKRAKKPSAKGNKDAPEGAASKDNKKAAGKGRKAPMGANQTKSKAERGVDKEKEAAVKKSPSADEERSTSPVDNGAMSKKSTKKKL